MLRDEMIDELVRSDLLMPYDFIDVSYANARFKEIKQNKLHKQMAGGIAPCIKTNIQNYGVVVYEN